MKSWLKYLIVAILVVGTGAVLVWFSEQTGDPYQKHKFTVVATINPIADIARNIAGIDAIVKTVLPPGANPHAFELTPREVVDLKDADLIFAVGQGVDNWASTLASNLTQAKLMSVNKNINLIPGDEHYWLTAQNGKIIARNIAQAFIEKDPANKKNYEANLSAYEKRLDQADAQIKFNLTGLKNKKIITHHNAWNYFAKAYGLTVLGSVESSEGKEPTPNDLARLSALAKKNNIKYIYIEPQLSEQVVVSFAKDNNLKIMAIDDIGTGSYIDMLLFDAGVFGATLK